MKRFRVIDFETTGFPPNAGVIEIGFTDLIWEGKSMEIGPTKSVFCNPGIPIEIGAMAQHHITEAMIKDAHHPSLYLDDCEEGADYIVGHNFRFEQAFHKFELPAICTLKCSRQLITDIKGHKNQELRYALFGDSLPSDRCDPPHRAGPDSYVTANILKHLLMLSAQQGGDFVGRLVNLTKDQTPEGKPIQGRLLEIVTFGKHAGKKWSEVPKSYMKFMLEKAEPDPDVRATMEHWLKQ